jgi:hypothetical protein
LRINFAKGFRRLTVVVSLALFLASSFFFPLGSYTKHFDYYNPNAPNWNEPGYKIYDKLIDRVTAAVDSGFITEDQGRAILDESTTPSETAAKHIHLLSYRDLTAAEKAELKEEPPFAGTAGEGPYGPNREPPFPRETKPLPAPPPGYTLTGYPGRPLIILSVLKGLTLPPNPVVPWYRRVNWENLRPVVVVTALPWLLYGIGLYLSRGFFGS